MPPASPGLPRRRHVVDEGGLAVPEQGVPDVELVRLLQGHGDPLPGADPELALRGDDLQVEVGHVEHELPASPLRQRQAEAVLPEAHVQVPLLAVPGRREHPRLLRGVDEDLDRLPVVRPRVSLDPHDAVDPARRPQGHGIAPALHAVLAGEAGVDPVVVAEVPVLREALPAGALGRGLQLRDGDGCPGLHALRLQRGVVIHLGLAAALRALVLEVQHLVRGLGLGDVPQPLLQGEPRGELVHEHGHGSSAVGRGDLQAELGGHARITGRAGGGALALA
eukprot:CAMPEP_0179257246 /NCGR_PEP_ID=MMETSP0797-20121207/24688_1 /TAXON_ID=47934 /ORGANISM="Dinophysis acuminata, Strain DAEP01" /LENGTH=278 /DNA_ID=CAMNT_0020965215 /DNA_START=62 /DNA_END=894 /DNA_ORIENTATION=+